MQLTITRLGVPALVLGLVLGTYASTTSAANNLISNGDFEQPAVSPGSFNYMSTLAGWTVTGCVEIDYSSPGILPASSGNQAAELDCDGTSRGSIAQDIPTQAGRNYVLRFAFGPRAGDGPTENILQVEWAGAPLVTLTADGTTSSAWQYYTYTVTATGSTTRLAFTDGGLVNGHGTELDDVGLVARTCASTGSFAWSTAAAWDCSSGNGGGPLNDVPKAGDDVKINAGHTITLDSSPKINSLQIADTASLKDPGSHTLGLAGDWSQDGTFDA